MPRWAIACSGPRVLRVDRLERLAAAARALARQGPFAATPALAQLAGAALDELAAMLAALGYRAVPGERRRRRFEPRPRLRRRGERAPRDGAARGAATRAADGPFAKLKELRLAR